MRADADGRRRPEGDAAGVRFTTLVLKNLVRQRTRTLLTVSGISLGIMTVVALGVITGGLKSSMGDLVRAGGADFLVAQKGASDLSFSNVSEEDVAAIAARTDVERATGLSLKVVKVPDNPFFMLFGIEPAALPTQRLTVLEGRSLAPGARNNEVMLGAQAASDLGARVGDSVSLGEGRFQVVGIYSGGDKLRDAGAVAPLESVQTLAGTPGLVTAAYVVAAEGADPDAVAAAIERELPRVATIRNVDEYSKVDQGVRIMDAANLAISLLAVGIGAIGVMNTMIMSVFERTREIGILRAVGWRGSRILRMIVFESLLLCVVAAGIGIALGVLVSRAVLLLPAVSSLLDPAYSSDVFVRALLVGVAVALVGALYPATRAVRLSPMEALRHE
jgi:putative ABC transport system permease protein